MSPLQGGDRAAAPSPEIAIPGLRNLVVSFVASFVECRCLKNTSGDRAHDKARDKDKGSFLMPLFHPARRWRD
jgi:hypothetical protein